MGEISGLIPGENPRMNSWSESLEELFDKIPDEFLEKIPGGFSEENLRKTFCRNSWRKYPEELLLGNPWGILWENTGGVLGGYPWRNPWNPRMNSWRNSPEKLQPQKPSGTNFQKYSLKKNDRICGESLWRNLLTNFWTESPQNILEKILKGFSGGNPERNSWSKPTEEFKKKITKKFLNNIHTKGFFFFVS